MENVKTMTIGALLATIIGNERTAFRVETFLAAHTTLPTKEDLMRIDGIGEATAMKVLACCELSARYIVGTEATSVIEPECIARRLAWLKYEPQESFCVVTLDSANHIINVHEITRGVANKVQAHPREVFRYAVMDSAVSVIVAHNHPSGSTEPSPDDVALTRLLCAAGKFMQIPVLDHVIVSRTGFTSLCRNNPEMFEAYIPKV